jgi:hypothetical protein
MTPLGCGCIVIGNARSYTACREGHGAGQEQGPAPARKKPALTKPPAAAATVEDHGAVETERKAKKRAEARESGRRLTPGRWKWDPATGEVVRVDEVSVEGVKP